MSKTIRKLREDGTPGGGAPGMSTPNATPPAANKTGDTPTMAMPPAINPQMMRRRYKQFDVDSDTFRKFENGRMKFEHWSNFLNLQNENHKAIYDYAYENRKHDHLIVLKNSDTGALRAIRRPASTE